MRYTYDPKADAASIYLKDPMTPGETAESVFCDAGDNGGMMLSLDRDGRIIEIEILQASKLLPSEALTGDQHLCSKPRHHSTGESR